MPWGSLYGMVGFAKGLKEGTRINSSQAPFFTIHYLHS